MTVPQPRSKETREKQNKSPYIHVPKKAELHSSVQNEIKTVVHICPMESRVATAKISLGSTGRGAGLTRTQFAGEGGDEQKQQFLFVITSSVTSAAAVSLNQGLVWSP